MSSLISRVTNTITADLSRGMEFLGKGEQAISGALREAATQTLNAGVGLAEGYAARRGSDLLAPGLLTLVSAPQLLIRSIVAPATSKPDSAYDGFFVGAEGKTFSPATPLNQIPTVKPSDGRETNETLIFINGINTSRNDQATSLQAIANQTGARVVGIHNGTDGMIADLSQSLTDKLDMGKNPAVDTLADTVYRDIKAGHSIHLIAHSQGGLITSRALNHVYQRLRIEDGWSKAATEKQLGMVKVETFGAAAGHYPDGPQYVHYINRDDPVPSLFGLGWDPDKFNPTLHAGRGAVVHWFNDLHLNRIASHSFSDVYLPRRVPFDQAQHGDW
jgi:hypothetical protein